jgi:hypothetical protein
MITMKMDESHHQEPSEPPAPTTKVLKARISDPPKRLPWVRMSRVRKCSAPTRRTVVTRSMVGKMENSVAFLVNRTMSRMRRLRVRFTAIKASSRIVERG